VHGVIVICVALFEGYIFGKSVALKVEITGNFNDKEIERIKWHQEGWAELVLQKFKKCKNHVLAITSS
jgi:hypothetical protein